ncbi:MAG TPA: hypothetical protein PKY59_24305 [Pyrinomonadaceae bacterium]|nr:hypothetical protein [Pyrinomonadaceae bacterium]
MTNNFTNKGFEFLVFILFLFTAFSTISAQVSETKTESPGKPEINEKLLRTEQTIESAKTEKQTAISNDENEIGETATTFDRTAFEKKFNEQSGFQPPPIFESSKRHWKDINSKKKDAVDIENGIDWSSAFKQSLLFLGVQHGYAVTQAKTRRALKGKFFKDYIDSVKSLHGWEDGGRFFTNYIAHPMQGSFTGFILVQNDRKGRQTEFGKSKEYWHSRLKALAWSAAWSTQFEIGPISQASIGNVGLSGKQTYVDVVITPTAGFGLMLAEDATDKYIIKGIERSTNNYYVKIFSRMLLNPTRTMANLIRFKLPWYRDNR